MVRLQRARWLGAVAVALTVVVLLLRLLHPLPSRATYNTWFAKPNGSGTACTQGSPCALANALARAQDNDIIYLAAGTYVGSDPAVVRVTKDLSLIGGWDGAASGDLVVDPMLYTPILDGQNRRRVVEVSPGASLFLGNLHVINGRRADEGAGIFAQDANVFLSSTQVYSNAVFSTGSAEVHGGGIAVRRGRLRVNDSSIHHNSASSHAGLSAGGGLYVEDAVSTTIEFCEFYSNDALSGAGLCVDGTEPNLAPLFVGGTLFSENGLAWAPGAAQRCEDGAAMELRRVDAQVRQTFFLGNEARTQGAGLDATGMLSVNRCWFGNNRAPTGSGLAISGASAFTLTNCFLVDNDLATPAGGACVWVSGESDGRLLHNTIARNLNVGPYYGVAAVGNSTLLMFDNIVAFQSVGVWVETGSSAELAATLLGSGAWGNVDHFGGGGVIVRNAPEIVADPGFVDPDGNNFSLAPGSAAIDAGVYAEVDEDYDGDARPQGAGYDIGADEYVAAQPTPSATPTQSPTPGATATRTATPTATRTATRGPTPSPTVAAPAPGVPGTYLCDILLEPGEIRRVNPATGAEDLVYRRQYALLTNFSLTEYPWRLYFLSANEFTIVTANNVGGVWQAEQTFYTHSTYVSDLAVVLGPDGSPVIYFSEANGLSGKIYRLAQGSVSLYYDVRPPNVAGWSGQFCFGEPGDLYLSQGNVTRARLYRLRGGTVQEIYREPEQAIVGMCYASGALYYADNRQHVCRLDLATVTRSVAYTSPALTRLWDVELFGRWVYLPVIKRGT